MKPLTVRNERRWISCIKEFWFSLNTSTIEAKKLFYREPCTQVHKRTYHNYQKWSFLRSKSHDNVGDNSISNFTNKTCLQHTANYDLSPTMSIMVMTSASKTLFSKLLIINMWGFIFNWFIIWFIDVGDKVWVQFTLVTKYF